MWVKVFALLTFVVGAWSAHQNLVQNPGFESQLRGHWETDGFSISRSSDAHSGSHSLKCTHRMKDEHQGPAQLVNLTPGKMYKFTAYLKQLNEMPGKMFQKYRANMQYVFRDTGTQARDLEKRRKKTGKKNGKKNGKKTGKKNGKKTGKKNGKKTGKKKQRYKCRVLKLLKSFCGTGKHSKESLVYHTSVRSQDGWFRMLAYFRAPKEAVTMSKLKFQAPDISIDFLLDDVSIVELPDLADWRTEADERIKHLRMGDINFQFNLGPGVQANDIEVQIDQVKHEFGWGTLVRDQWMTDHNHKRYQDMVYEYFNTATTQGLKWKFDKGTPNHPDYSQAMACVNNLRQHGMRVRAHNLFWGFTKNLPDYVLHLAHNKLNNTVQDHLHYMMNITKGKADHWDVMNELIHGQWFEEQFHDPYYSEKIYKQVRQLDPKPLLMLNDFSVVARPEIADAYLQQAQRFLAHGVPLQALGLQGHFHDTVPDPQRMLLYLDHVAQAGLPLWVTELDVWQQDPDVRAKNYEIVLRVLFSHPDLRGIVFWGFWDQHVVDKRSSLVDGDHLHINAAGKRVFSLIKDEWSTHAHRSLSSGTNFHLRGFKGDYKVKVKRHGLHVKVVPFTLTGNQTTVNIDVDSS